MSGDEHQYLTLVQKILTDGNYRSNRTDTKTYSIFGAQMRFDLRRGFPLLTTKELPWRIIVEELLWFVAGHTNAKLLQQKNIHIWDGNSSRQFLDGMGFVDRAEGDLGPIYGFQWRHCGAKYGTCNDDYTGQGIDQLQNIIDRIRADPYDRRMIMCAWNPVDIPDMALPPCHCLVQFYVDSEKRELSCHMYQRSADMGLGVPFNIASYALLTHMIAHVCELQPGDFIHSIGDAHIYENHKEQLLLQLTRAPKPFPSLRIKHPAKNIDDFTLENFELVGYNPHPKIILPLSA